ncbi:hypothetical protein GobsT_49880 [Gemmata obscuriglobus]|uniref:DUF1269 domain-containing protein n=1 Tax=Gemmata obscuriglobus TaxID=114 RepID=A0A2Z3GTJ3_9BACT|nr:hypothetical protein [Gemmata obscuriglobus]AWM37093.1 hypothetical protein C1280_08685 [Gemmata obscuriglobus]QEG30185.1 hypothetical protein GobsT_49880 [Gemmata obscuriglobus]VTS09509.1 Uncharacterized protein OS=Singulisphaera acidiphila (strain ATCC BAA-1392 / DSM 18658 / VKM B-2454 / MOB10) GN=Sinac_4599 PE=4 SV=1 [Gemmata obscuriglobus UQM 2246]
MTTDAPDTAVGVFGDRTQADRALAALRVAGFEGAELGIGSGAVPADRGEPTWESGAALGSMSGAALGGLAAGPAGLLGGALVGLLLGTLVDLGVSEGAARWYADQARAGRVVVTVRAPGRYAEAHAILLRHGGHEAPPL